MKKKIYKTKKIFAIALITLLPMFLLLLILLIYIYNLDKFDPEITDYYVKNSKQKDESTIYNKIVNNSKGLFGKTASRFMRWKAQTNYLKTHRNEQEIINNFIDKNTPIANKRFDAWRLAMFNTEAAHKALLTALRNNNPEVRKAVAIAFAHSDYPDAKEIVRMLLNDPDENVVTGAIEALGLFADDESISMLDDILNNENSSEKIREKAAAVLGDTGSQKALNILLQTFNTSENQNLNDAIVTSIGKFPFEKTQSFFHQLMTDDSIPSDIKKSGVEALADSSEDAIPFLIETAKSYDDPEIRESAAWTLGNANGTGEFADDLTVMLQQEPIPDVRRRLYESLINQNKIQGDIILNLAEQEQNIATKIAAANAAAAYLKQQNAKLDDINKFDKDLVPILKNKAIGQGSVNLQLRSIFALKRAGTSESLKALEEISKESNNKLISGAATRALASLKK